MTSERGDGVSGSDVMRKEVFALDVRYPVIALSHLSVLCLDLRAPAVRFADREDLKLQLQGFH